MSSSPEVVPSEEEEWNEVDVMPVSTTKYSDEDPFWKKLDTLTYNHDTNEWCDTKGRLVENITAVLYNAK